MALPAAELVRLAPPETRQPDRLEHLAGPTTTFGAADALDLEPVLDVRLHVHVGEQRVVLEHGVEVAVVRGESGDVRSAEQDGAGGRKLEPGDHAEHRGLAAARWPEEREELAVVDREVDAVDRGDVTEALGEADELDRGRRVVLGRPCAAGRLVHCCPPQLTRRIRKSYGLVCLDVKRAGAPTNPEGVAWLIVTASISEVSHSSRRCSSRWRAAVSPTPWVSSSPTPSSSGSLRRASSSRARARWRASSGCRRSRLREALATLRHRGLVETRRGRNGGSFVCGPAPAPAARLRARLRDLSSVELRDLGDEWTAVTGTTARLAATRASDDQVERLRTLGRRSRSIEVDQRAHASQQPLCDRARAGRSVGAADPF